MDQIDIKEGRREKPKRKKIFTPAQILALGFAGVIILGTLLLSLPSATSDGHGASLINAFFTSTSAVCVTGLVVVDTGNYFTVFGQLVIMLLIQIGGLGFMSIASLYAIILGKRIMFRERILLQEAYNQLNTGGIVKLVKNILLFTFVLEGLGALILAIRWAGQLGWGKALYFGIFHAISAFNNAGFDLFGGYQSLNSYVGDVTVNLVIASLVVLGGLGFTVLTDVYARVKEGTRLHLHSLLVLRTTAVLIIVGALVIFCLELANPRTLLPLDSGTRVLAAFFQSITSRTAGFGTLAIGDLRDTTLFFIIILMFIGASPGSTGGGIKTTTFVSILLSVKASLTGKQHVTVHERTLPNDLIRKAYLISTLGIMLIIIVVSILTITEKADFLSLLFDTVSAFSLVGLSTGITPNLTPAGKFVLALTMYVGRVGLLTIAYALVQMKKDHNVDLKYPEERVLIG
jgi:trk system potassium uptake protein TrkH